MFFSDWEIDLGWVDFWTLDLGLVYDGFTISKNGIVSVWTGSRLVFHNIRIESAPAVAK